MTAISFPRPAPAVRDILRSSPLEATISTKPIPGATGDRPLPWIQVVTDSRYRSSRLDGTALVRLVVWAIDEGAAEELAELAEAYLLAKPLVHPSIRSIESAIGPFSSHDTDADLPIASVTVQAHLRPQNL